MTRKAYLKSSRHAIKELCPMLFLVLICFLFSLPVSAQVFDTGTIGGMVTDPSGAVVPHATVTITNVGTGIRRTLQTDNGGSFVASALPFGSYVVSGTASGFGEATSKPIVLNVGATVQVNLGLTVTATQEKIEVTGTSTTIDTTSTATGTTLDSNQIANLPINGRDVSGFLEIAPGSINSTGFFQGSVNGLENIFTGLNIKLDGQNASRGDINGFLETEGQEQARVTRASVDSIQEIDFTNNGYSTENGFSLGPQMNIITKSGSNEYHGTVFEFLRNDALDAKDFFENATTGLPKQPLRLNQFGGNLGGPIIKNKVFFFTNYEGVRQHITNINALNHTVSAFARSHFNTAMQPVLAQMAPLPSACSGNPPPQSCWYPGFDVKNSAGQSINTNMVYDPAALPTILREDTGSIRVDYNISDKDRLMGRYNINDSLTNYTFGLNQGQVSPQKLRTQLGKIDETHTFSPTFLNEFSIGLNRFYSDTNSNTPTPLAGFSGFFTDLGSLPGPNAFNQITPFSVFEVFDTLTKTVGNHTLKFGTQIRANRLNEWLRPQQTYYFGNISDLENDNPFVLSKIGFPGFVGIRNSNWDFYVQDDWRVTHRVTVNLGLRYEYNTAWNEGHGRLQNFDVATQSFLPAGKSYNARRTDFAPRIGFSWDPFGKGKTVVHGYGGIFYMPMQFGFGLVTNIPALSSYNVDVFQAIFGNPPFSIAYPSPNPPLQAGTQNVNAFPQNPKDPYSTNWLLGIQQEVARNTVLTVNYTGNKTQHMQAGVSFAAPNANPANIVTQARTFSGFANENLNSDTLSSNYNALQVQLRRNAGRLTMEANYTWSHEIDDLVNVFSGWSDPLKPSLDRGSGDWDVRHNLTASAVYSLPEPKNSNSLVRTALGGWQTSTILQTRSGLPANVQLISGFFGIPMRPNSVAGQKTYLPSVHWPDSSFNIKAFALEPNYNGQWGDVIGTVGRNALRGPAFFQLDWSVMKNFRVTERLKLQFRADLFNMLNHPNFGPPDAGICTTVQPATATMPADCYTVDSMGNHIPAINKNFGRTGQTIADVNGSQIGTGTARQTQFALKLMF
ncbi:MAG TPA: TonB-dependent receptor [Candidatus Polarisedimenticolia bacterium]|nr:TonB-dependent receptor [Candidatus Polarisedimenticolia bacterium]